mmetsp:Transcript_3114/g.7253  ORF Transcript_3114/g.7253 Transcript_3114/m.7253 type:complete len:313 (+) Transcript_3114:1369-2307(+)
MRLGRPPPPPRRRLRRRGGRRLLPPPRGAPRRPAGPRRGGLPPGRNDGGGVGRRGTAVARHGDQLPRRGGGGTSPKGGGGWGVPPGDLGRDLHRDLHRDLGRTHDLDRTHDLGAARVGVHEVVHGGVHVVRRAVGTRPLPAGGPVDGHGVHRPRRVVKVRRAQDELRDDLVGDPPGAPRRAVPSALLLVVRALRQPRRRVPRGWDRGACVRVAGPVAPGLVVGHRRPRPGLRDRKDGVAPSPGPGRGPGRGAGVLVRGELRIRRVDPRGTAPDAVAVVVVVFVIGVPPAVGTGLLERRDEAGAGGTLLRGRR